MKRSDYITILPQKSETYYTNIQYDNLCIEFRSNVDVLSNIVNGYVLSKEMPSDKKRDAMITVIVDKNIFVDSHLDDKTPEGFILKSNPVYHEENQNRIFEIAPGKRIWINYYPTHFMCTYNQLFFEYDSICGSMKAANFVSKSLVKQAFVDIYVSHGAYPIHAAAVCDSQQNVYLFVAGSHCGKTTLYLNLLCHGYKSMNDDLVFLKQSECGVDVLAIPTLPSIRENSWDHVPSMRIENNRCDILHKYACERFQNMGKLKAIFLPRLGYEATRAYQVDHREYRKNILRAMSMHHSLVGDICLLHLLKSMQDKPLYILELSEKMDDFFETFNEIVVTL